MTQAHSVPLHVNARPGGTRLLLPVDATLVQTLRQRARRRVARGTSSRNLPFALLWLSALVESELRGRISSAVVADWTQNGLVERVSTWRSDRGRGPSTGPSRLACRTPSPEK